MLIAESLDVGVGLLKLLLVIEHICHSLRGVAIPTSTWFLLSTQHGLNAPLPLTALCTLLHKSYSFNSGFRAWDKLNLSWFVKERINCDC
ncbi:hypothetical protein [Nodularia sp. UHCC 0506]|uniref:hypothetical protein n=1 Tax=Nodularia sp. UHCC 0506 TaxID=3110243 RepID=UPI002B1FB7F5|nr:hypothetical protein [Nodularia sp. UHCC 0506]MEA5513095.1 hypothetical protein [Nodularia sp. UHCC 0506]